MSFQSNKVHGYDKVLIKDALPCILSALTDIVNHSLLSSVFPASWKILEVVPFPKDGDHGFSKQQSPCFFASSYVTERYVNGPP